MASAAFTRITHELFVHPDQRLGFMAADFDTLEGAERERMCSRFMGLVENGWGYAEQLDWLLGDAYVATLRARLAELPPDSPGQTILPYLVYLKTGDSARIDDMVSAVVEADARWRLPPDVIGGYVQGLRGQEPVFWDLCRFIVIHVPDRAIKEAALLWLAYEKDYPVTGLTLPDELATCVDRLCVSQGKNLAALALLNSLHEDSGRLGIL
jgi:hypothetical protein